MSCATQAGRGTKLARTESRPGLPNLFTGPNLTAASEKSSANLAQTVRNHPKRHGRSFQHQWIQRHFDTI